MTLQIEQVIDSLIDSEDSSKAFWHLGKKFMYTSTYIYTCLKVINARKYLTILILRVVSFHMWIIFKDEAKSSYIYNALFAKIVTCFFIQILSCFSYKVDMKIQLVKTNSNQLIKCTKTKPNMLITYIWWCINNQLFPFAVCTLCKYSF